MQKPVWLFSLSFFTLLATSVEAQKYSNEFLSIGVGARAQAMGGAQVSFVSDASSGFWNPAGLTGLGRGAKTDLDLAAMHAEWFGGIGKYDYVGAALPLPGQERYLGLTFIRFGVDGIPNTLSLYNEDGSVNYDNVTEFSAADYALMGSYAQELGTTGLSLGGSLKMVHRRIGSFAQSWGFGADLGAQYRLKDWRFGLMLKDITTTFNAWRFSFSEEDKRVLAATNNEIPIQSLEITRPQIILGASRAWRIPLGKASKEEGQPDERKSMGILAAVDFLTTTDGQRNTLLSSRALSMDPLIGLELDYEQFIFLRAGMSNFQRIRSVTGQEGWSVQPNFGIGLRIRRVHIDYAMSNLGGNSGVLYSHIVSLRMGIDFDFFKKLKSLED